MPARPLTAVEPDADADATIASFTMIVTEGPQLVVAGDYNEAGQLEPLTIAETSARINAAKELGHEIVLLPLWTSDPFDPRGADIEETGIAIRRILLVSRVHANTEKMEQRGGSQLIVPKVTPTI